MFSILDAVSSLSVPWIGCACLINLRPFGIMLFEWHLYNKDLCWSSRSNFFFNLVFLWGPLRGPPPIGRLVDAGGNPPQSQTLSYRHQAFLWQCLQALLALPLVECGRCALHSRLHVNYREGSHDKSPLQSTLGCCLPPRVAIPSAPLASSVEVLTAPNNSDDESNVSISACTHIASTLASSWTLMLNWQLSALQSWIIVCFQHRTFSLLCGPSLEYW